MGSHGTWPLFGQPPLSSQLCYCRYTLSIPYCRRFTTDGFYLLCDYKATRERVLGTVISILQLEIVSTETETANGHLLPNRSIPQPTNEPALQSTPRLHLSHSFTIYKTRPGKSSVSYEYLKSLASNGHFPTELRH